MLVCLLPAHGSRPGVTVKIGWDCMSVSRETVAGVDLLGLLLLVVL